MIPLLVIRPQPGCDATVAAAREVGLAAYGFPLFEIVPVAWDAPDPTTFDALLIGSANALRHAGPTLRRYRRKPAYAVGKTSAEAARAAGLDVVDFGEGGLQRVISGLKGDHRRLLRLAGREHVRLTVPPGVTMIERVVYASEPQPMPEELAQLLRRQAVVLVHSGEAARHFAALCDDRGIARNELSLVAIGKRVADELGPGWRMIATPHRPDNTAMLVLAREMCQTSAGPGELQDRT